MQTLIKITLSTLALLLLLKIAQVSIDRITVRDCARNITAACEEVTRLNLK